MIFIKVNNFSISWKWLNCNKINLCLIILIISCHWFSVRVAKMPERRGRLWELPERARDHSTRRRAFRFKSAICASQHARPRRKLQLVLEKIVWYPLMNMFSGKKVKYMSRFCKYSRSLVDEILRFFKIIFFVCMWRHWR